MDGEAFVISSDGVNKTIDSLNVGDKVKTLDDLGNLIDTEVIMIMDLNTQICRFYTIFILLFIKFINLIFFFNNAKASFLNIKTYSGKNLRVSVSHLIAVPNGEFKLARDLKRGDYIVTYDHDTSGQSVEKIESILIEYVRSYAAPLTMHGTLLANNILVSSYASIDDHHLAHKLMSPVRWWYLIQNKFMERFVKRAMFNDNYAQLLINPFQIEKQSNGTHWFPKLLSTLADSYILNKIVRLN